MYRLRGRRGALATVALAVASVGLGSARVVAASPDAVSVSIVRATAVCPQPPTRTATYCFQPTVVTTQRGGTVTWTNTTKTTLTLTTCTQAGCPGTGGDSPFGASGEPVVGHGSYPFAFTSPGTYYYDCKDSLCAIGEVIVNASTPSPTPVVLSPGPGTAPLATPTPFPTPLPTPSPTPPPSDTPSAVAVTTPSPDASPTASAPDQIGAVGSTGGGGQPPLLPIVVVILALIAVGGGMMSFRLYRR